MNNTLLIFAFIICGALLFNKHQAVKQELETVKQESKEKSQDIEILKFNYTEDILTLLRGRKDVSVSVTTLSQYDDYVLCATIRHDYDCQFVLATHKDKMVLNYELSELKKQIQGE